MITTELIDKLIKLIQYNDLTVATIEKMTHRSRRNLLNDIEQVNDLFIDYDIKIIVDENEILKITKFDIQDIIENVFLNNEFLFQQERPYMVILYIFLKQGFVSANHFQELLQMSKNSVLSDINEANDISREDNVEIKYSRKHGYELIGNKLDIRQLINNIVTSILNFSTGKKIIEYITKKWNLSLEIRLINRLLTETNEVSFVNERLEDVIYLISILEIGPVIKDKDLILKEEELRYIENSKTYELTKEIVNGFPKLKTQEFYITIQLLSVIQADLETDQIDYFKEMLEEIIVNVQGYAGSIFPNTEAFRKNLYNHLVPAYFRMRFQIQLNNPLKKQIINDYPNLFYLIKRSLEPLSKHSDFEITNDEITYFVMHFGSYFSSSIEKESKKLTAVILCPHGMGTSLLLKNLLSSVMSEINFVKHSSEDLKNNKLLDVDFIISTIYYESEIPVYLINPSMSHLEITLLKRKIYEEFSIQTESLKTVDELYEKIKYLSNKHDPLIVKSEMDRVLDINLKMNYKEIENYEFGPLLTDEMITQKERVTSWEEAINIASKPLLEFDYINENYIKSMINTIKKYGPYVVLVPQVALPHAKPADGSHKLGVSLLQLEDSVMFKKEDSDVPVRLLFVVSISDKYSHLSILKRLNSIIIDKNIVSALTEAKTKKEILKIISENDLIN